MRRSRKLRWAAGILLPVMIFVSGCLPEDGADAGTAPKPADARQTAPKPAGCGQPGPLVKQWLPTFDHANAREATIEQLKNPCPPLAGLFGLVNDVIPVSDAANAQVDKFVKNVRGTADRFLTLVDLTKCAYETDRLAVGVYQHHDTRWSVGVVVVVRGHLGAVADVVACYVEGQIASGLRDIFKSEGNRPAPQFCAMAGAPQKHGEAYTVVVLGSSNWMCAALGRTPGITARVVS